MGELELSEIFEKIFIQALWITISVLVLQSILFIELNLIPIAARPRRYSGSFILFSFSCYFQKLLPVLISTTAKTHLFWLN